MSRSENLRAEYLEHQEFLRAHPASGNPSAAFAAEQLNHRLAEIDDELAQIAEPHLDVRLVGDLTDRHSIPTDLLTALVGRFQKAMTWTVWALKAGPGVAGTPPAAVERSAAAEVYALAPGSFKLSLRRHDTSRDGHQEQLNTTDELFKKSLDAFVEISAAAESARYEAVEETVQQMGRSASRRVQLLFGTLAKSGTTAEFTWHADRVRQITVSPERADSLVQWLSAYNETRQVISVTGVLTVVDTERGRFGLRDAAERLYAGKAPVDLLTGGTVGVQYIAEIEIAERTGQHTGAHQELMVLRSLDPVTPESR